SALANSEALAHGRIIRRAYRQANSNTDLGGRVPFSFRRRTQNNCSLRPNVYSEATITARHGIKFLPISLAISRTPKYRAVVPSISTSPERKFIRLFQRSRFRLSMPILFGRDPTMVSST